VLKVLKSAQSSKLTNSRGFSISQAYNDKEIFCVNF
jgi:hypothetical protein